MNSQFRGFAVSQSFTSVAQRFNRIILSAGRTHHCPCTDPFREIRFVDRWTFPYLSKHFESTTFFCTCLFKFCNVPFSYMLNINAEVTNTGYD